MSDLIKLLAVHWWDEGNMGVCECGEGFAHWDEWAVHINALIAAEYLVVPRSDIVGTEYGWRYAEPGEEPRTWRCDKREDAIEAATHLRSMQRRKGREENAEALSHPILPWTPIPLPEDGEPR